MSSLFDTATRKELQALAKGLNIKATGPTALLRASVRAASAAAAELLTKLRRRRRPRCCTANSSCEVEPDKKQSTKRSPLAAVRLSLRWWCARPELPKASGKL